MKSERNYMVEIWRVIFCLVVLGFHFCAKFDLPYFHIGYLAVEFFFLLSGYGIYRSYRYYEDKGYKKNRINYLFAKTGRRFSRLYPLYLCSMLFMMLVKVFITHQLPMNGFLGYAKSCWAEFLMLQCSPLGGEVMISANWYAAVLFWGSLLLLAFLLLFREVGALLFCPVIGIGIYAYYYRLIGKIDVIFSYHAFLRGIAGLCMGIFLGALARKCRGFLFSKGKVVDFFTWLIANFLFVWVLLFTNVGHRSRMDFAVIAVCFVSLFLLLTQKDNCPEGLQDIIKVLSGATLPIYLLQMPVLEILAHYHILG